MNKIIYNKDNNFSNLASIITNGESLSIEYDFNYRKTRRNGKVMDIGVARENLKLLKRVFDNNNIKFFLVCGTCLGAVRNGDFIPYDTDTDIGVYRKDKLKIASVIKELNEVGLIPIRATQDDSLLTLMRDDEYIDIGFFRKTIDSKGNISWNSDNNPVAGDHFDCLSEIEFIGEKFFVPSDVKNYLKKIYGVTWKIPIKEIPNTSNYSPYMLMFRRFIRKVLHLQVVY